MHYLTFCSATSYEVCCLCHDGLQGLHIKTKYSVHQNDQKDSQAGISVWREEYKKRLRNPVALSTEANVNNEAGNAKKMVYIISIMLLIS